MTECHARLLAEVTLPQADRLMTHQQGVHRTADVFLVGMATDDQLIVHDMNRLLAGDTEPVATFPATWTKAVYPEGSFTPDLTTAFFSQPDRVVAVDSAGVELWSHRHRAGPWGTWETGSTLVTADGSQVWAVVPGPEDSQNWVVFDPASGLIIGETVAVQRRGPSPRQFAHPDGSHVGLSCEEFEFSSLNWGFFDSAMWVAQLGNSAPEVIYITDIRPAGDQLLLMDHEGHTLSMCEFPSLGGVRDIDSSDISDLLGEDYSWYQHSGFLSADKVIACGRGEVRDDDYPHLLCDMTTQRLLGRVNYPRPVDEYLWALGDGTWLTADEEALRHWTLDD